MNVPQGLKELIHFQDSIFAEKERLSLLAFISAYAIFSFNVVPVNLILLVILLIFLFSSANTCLFMFTFYTLWEYVSVIGNGITLNLILHIILFAKICLSTKRISICKQHNLFIISVLWALFTLSYAIIGLVSTKGFEGFHFFIKSMVVVYALSYMMNEDDTYDFWKTIFQLIAISTIFSAIYGFFYNTSLERWIVGLEGHYGSQLYGTLGTTRLGMFTVVSLVYPLYFVQDKLLKYALIITFIILTLKTISITALGLLACLFMIYLYSKRYLWAKGFFSITILVLVLILSWPRLSHISVVRPIALRIEYSMNKIKKGNIDKATTGRSELKDFYTSKFDDLPLVNQYFGTGSSSALKYVKNASYLNSHNSYIDMMFYWGRCGIFFLLFVTIRKVMHFRNSFCFYPIFTLKICFLIVTGSVSVFSSTFWSFFIYL